MFGLRALGSPIRVHGICVRRTADAKHERLAARCREMTGLLGMASPVADAGIAFDDAFLAPGYGRLNQAASSAIQRAAQTEALILDSVYTGKVMAGFLKRVAAAGPGDSLLFWHTGGAPAVFAYGDDLMSAPD